MPKTSIQTSGRPDKLDFIADHLALDLLNTVRTVGDGVKDTLETDEDVRVWLKLAGVNVPKAPLLAEVRQLREAARAALEARKEGSPVDLEVINRYLQAASSHPMLTTDLKLERVYEHRTPAELLAPLSEAIADLLANGDLSLIHRCAGDDCVLWFYDRTKGHARRFCSAAGCGNRAKVAAFRARAREAK